MRNTMFMLVVAALMAVSAGSACAVGKITQDPNSAGGSTQTSTANLDLDERLARKITYFSGYSRLSSAVSGISRLSDIKIYAGSAATDWQVRDMPVVICANDIEVGTLLKLMADTYFLTLSKTDVDGVPIFRLLRPKAYQGLLRDYGGVLRNNASDWAASQWNIFGYVGSLKPEEAEALYQQTIKKRPNFGVEYKSDIADQRLAFDEIALHGQLINSIDESSYAKLLNGEEIALSAEQGGDVSKLVMDFARLKQKVVRTLRCNNSSDTGDFLSESDVEHAQVRFRLNENRGFCLESTISAGDFVSTGFHGDLLTFGMTSASTLVPKNPLAPSLQMKSLKKATKDDEMEPKGKFEFKAPSKEQLQLADVLTEVSKATGYSILADDYCDHKDNPGISCKDIFKDKKSMLDVKKSLGNRYEWYVRPGAKVLSVKNSDWAYRYANLVSEKLFSGWLSKAKGSGLELDDYLAVWRLTSGQRWDWIDGIRNLNGVAMNGLNDKQKFELDVLSSMTQSDLSAAQSGVPVARLNTDQFTRFFNSLAADARPKDDISQLELRLTKEAQEGSQKYTYSMGILGSQTNLKLALGVSFPIYSPDKEKELKSVPARQDKASQSPNY